MKKSVFFLLASLLFFSCADKNISEVNPTYTNAELPKNVILLIGDGTGLSQISAAEFYQSEPSNYERFPITGFIKTSSSSDLITDSAAGATAFANGIKTYNGAVGVNSDTLAIDNIVEIVSKEGMTTGIISTSSITHATPACFYAHAPSRNDHEEIAADLVTSEIDFFAGAGTKYFLKRKDGRNLLNEMKRKGFFVDTSGLNDHSDFDKVGYLLADKSMPKMLEGRGDFLPNASEMAIERLQNRDAGFFLMIEGSQIDWGGHDNDADYLISELLDFDKTIGAVLDFAQKEGETLVIVTADHETGGFTLGADDGDYNRLKPSFSTNGHSATWIPVFAYGPGANQFSGIYENNEIFHKIKQLLVSRPRSNTSNL